MSPCAKLLPSAVDRHPLFTPESTVMAHPITLPVNSEFLNSSSITAHHLITRITVQTVIASLPILPKGGFAFIPLLTKEGLGEVVLLDSFMDKHHRLNVGGNFNVLLQSQPII